MEAPFHVGFKSDHTTKPATMSKGVGRDLNFYTRYIASVTLKNVEITKHRTSCALSAQPGNFLAIRSSPLTKFKISCRRVYILKHGVINNPYRAARDKNIIPTRSTA